MQKGETCKDKYINKQYKSKQGYIMTVIDYKWNNDVTVQFDDEFKTVKHHCRIDRIRSGDIANPNHPTVFGVGIIGENPYPITINGVNTREYYIWHAMIQRCYDPNWKPSNAKFNSYEDCYVDKRWHLYNNFYEWVHEQDNYIKWANGGFHIDKDILVKGNKVYSPETCCLVPAYVNMMFVKCDNSRTDLPLGVYKCYNKYKVLVGDPITNKRVYLGLYNTVEEAFFAYKNYKENLIKQVAKTEYNNGNIIKKCYESMMNYEVEITD